ncbi:hypothetical protein BDV06DRAFT_183380 [Aspergillus oleicola]
MPPPQIPPIFLSTSLTKTLLSPTNGPPYKVHQTAATSSKIPNPFFNITARTPSPPSFPSDPQSTTTTKPPAILNTLFLSRPSPTVQGHLLIHCGPGITGQNAIAHGGFLATVLDEVCGNLISAEGVDGGLGMFTVRLDVRYVRPVFVDDFDVSGGEGGGQGGKGKGEASVIVASAQIERVEGRKVFVSACVKDSDGEVCTRGDAVFVKKKGQAAL